jgi:glutamate N-acetyltransferase/amino-acid N-acetyltransferase
VVSERELIVVSGFRFSGVHCGIKTANADLALIASDRPTTVAGVFTRSTVVGAPVTVSRELVRNGRARGVVVNSGVSNVAMGARGVRDARSMAREACRAVGVDDGEMLVASTGVIGEPLPLPKIRKGIRAAAAALSSDGLNAAARAIMTTDTVPKTAVARFSIGRREVTVAGIAKGSGMIQPNMATMLAFLVTDAAVAAPFLRRVLRRAADVSFNRLTVDGESSTSDTVLLFANGASETPRIRDARSPGAARFQDAVTEVSLALTRALARDGEGATRLVTVTVEGARTPAEAERGARRIANSPMVKTAIYGGDPNWGRILQTLGAGRVALRLDRTVVRLGGVVVFRRGASAGPAARKRAAARHSNPEIEIHVELGAGRARAQLFTCDLTPEYVHINADYTT